MRGFATFSKVGLAGGCVIAFLTACTVAPSMASESDVTFPTQHGGIFDGSAAHWAREMVTSRWLVEFLDTVRVSFCDYAAASSGIATSSASTCRSFMECSLK